MRPWQITQTSGAEAPVAERVEEEGRRANSGTLPAPASSPGATPTRHSQGGGASSSPAPPSKSSERHAALAAEAYRLGFTTGLSVGLEHATDQIRAAREALQKGV